MLRTRVYIDGYNFYYGCLKRTPYKWLDLFRLFDSHILRTGAINLSGTGEPLPAFELLPLGIKYFTAEILEKVAAHGSDSLSSQARYHTALRKLYSDKIECIKGYYSIIQSKAKIVDAEEPDRWPRDCQEILVWKPEEKQSDVNLALHLYHDAITGQVDHAVVVTNDTDIAPSLEMVRRNTKTIIGLVVPTRDSARVPNEDLAKLAHWVRGHITDEELRLSQLPRVIQGRSPTIKPNSWYARPDLLERTLERASAICGGTGRAFKWLEQPNRFLNNESPIDLIETEEGTQRVLEYMDQYERDHGPKAQ